MRRWRCLVLSACAAATCGCFPREQQRIGAVDPISNIPAIQGAARDKDYKAIPQLVRELDSDDPAVRFYAIQALQKLTGETFGYQFYDDASERRPAVRRWQQWVRERNAGRGDAATR
jgi:hypothetical protein